MRRVRQKRPSCILIGSECVAAEELKGSYDGVRLLIPGISLPLPKVQVSEGVKIKSLFSFLQELDRAFARGRSSTKK